MLKIVQHVCCKMCSFFTTFDALVLSDSVRTLQTYFQGKQVLGQTSIGCKQRNFIPLWCVHLNLLSLWSHSKTEKNSPYVSCFHWNIHNYDYVTFNIPVINLFNILVNYSTYEFEFHCFIKWYSISFLKFDSGTFVKYADHDTA